MCSIHSKQYASMNVEMTLYSMSPLLLSVHCFLRSEVQKRHLCQMPPLADKVITDLTLLTCCCDYLSFEYQPFFMRRWINISMAIVRWWFYTASLIGARKTKGLLLCCCWFYYLLLVEISLDQSVLLERWRYCGAFFRVMMFTNEPYLLNSSLNEAKENAAASGCTLWSQKWQSKL